MTSRRARLPLPWFLCALALAPSAAHAGGWTQPRGAYYLKLWVRSLFGSRGYFTDRAARPLGATYQDHALNLYGEYGLTSDWTLVAFARPVGHASFGDSATAYMGELAAGARRGLLRGRVNLAVEAHASVTPDVGERVLGAGVVEGRSFVYVPTASTARFDAELQAGLALGAWGWVTAAAGARFYTRDAIDHALYGSLQFGVQTSFGLQLMATATTQQPLGHVVATNAAGAGQTRYVSYGLDASFWFTRRWAVTAGFAGALLVESNAATPSRRPTAPAEAGASPDEAPALTGARHDRGARGTWLGRRAPRDAAGPARLPSTAPARARITRRRCRGPRAAGVGPRARGRPARARRSPP